VDVNEAIHVSDSNFEKAVLQSPLPVLVDFWAPWCAPCRMVAPYLEGIAREYSGRLVVAKVNIDDNPEWATKYGVRGIPTMLFVSEGKVAYEQVGAVPYGALKQMVERLLSENQVQKAAV
jgi:thioredoxin 1